MDEQRLIDANKLIEKAYWHCTTPSYRKPYSDGHHAVDVEDIENAPAVCAVPVVRCKDCTRRYDTEQGCWCDVVDGVVEDDFFCAYGETMRKERDSDG